MCPFDYLSIHIFLINFHLNTFSLSVVTEEVVEVITVINVAVVVVGILVVGSTNCLLVNWSEPLSILWKIRFYRQTHSRDTFFWQCVCTYVSFDLVKISPRCFKNRKLVLVIVAVAAVEVVIVVAVLAYTHYLFGQFFISLIISWKLNYLILR